MSSFVGETRAVPQSIFTEGRYEDLCFETICKTQSPKIPQFNNLIPNPPHLSTPDLTPFGVSLNKSHYDTQYQKCFKTFGPFLKP